MQTQHYVLSCYRYIEMNPVRANMVKHPIDYPWSSYAANAAGKKVEWLTPHGEYLALGSEESKRLAAYRGLFATDLDAELLREIRTSTPGSYAIGDSPFREEIEHALNRHATPAVRAVGRCRGWATISCAADSTSWPCSATGRG
jgi:putative transposase